MTTYGPSAIDPAEWSVIGVFYKGTDDDMHDAYAPEHLELDRLLGENWDERVTAHSNGGCASCGSHYAHGVVVRRGESEDISIGHTCAEMFGLPDSVAKRKRTAIKARKRIATYNEGERFLDTMDLREIFDNYEDVRGSNGGVLLDMLSKVHRYGELSEKQVNYARLIWGWHIERKEAFEAKQAERNPVPVTDDRITIEGVVISTKWQDSDYGGAMKMLVEDDRGFRLWGTVPRSLDGFNDIYDGGRFCGQEYNLEPGSRVRFVARIEVSAKDETFGFYKRPTKAEKLEEVTV